MPASVKTTIIGSILLILTGFGFYFGTGMASITALIPAFIGFPMLICGLAAIKPAMLKVAMHVAALIALLGAVGSTRVFTKWADLTVAARSAQLITFTVCTVLLVAFIGSFVQARRNRQQQPEVGSA